MTNPPRDLVYEWREKLRRSGFHDIERPDGTLLEHTDRQREKLDTPIPVREAAAAYYTRAEHFIQSSTFRRLPSSRRKAWALHARGLSQRQIAHALQTSRRSVRLALRAGARLARLPTVSV